MKYTIYYYEVIPELVAETDSLEEALAKLAETAKKLIEINDCNPEILWHEDHMGFTLVEHHEGFEWKVEFEIEVA